MRTRLPFFFLLLLSSSCFLLGRCAPYSTEVQGQLEKLSDTEDMLNSAIQKQAQAVKAEQQEIEAAEKELKQRKEKLAKDIELQGQLGKKLAELERQKKSIKLKYELGKLAPLLTQAKKEEDKWKESKKSLADKAKEMQEKLASLSDK